MGSGSLGNLKGLLLRPFHSQNLFYKEAQLPVRYYRKHRAVYLCN